MKKIFIGTLLCALLSILVSCGDSITTGDDDEHTHDYGEWKIIQKATCAEDGVKEKTCSCGKKKTKKIEKGHTIVVEAAVAPGCSTEGLTEGSHCSVCGEIIEAQTVISAVGHDIVYDMGVLPTCIETGLSTGLHCSTCGEVISEQKIINATGHIDSDYDDVCDYCGSYLIVVSQGLSYIVNSDGKSCTITGIGICTDDKVVIPSKIDEYSVTGIGYRAFYACDNIVEITIPKSIKNIDEQVFYKASNLTTVYLNSTYYSVNNAFLANTNVKKVVFGYVKKAGEICRQCPNIKEISFSESITEIDDLAFYNCTCITSVIIPNSVTKIGHSAFENCVLLKNIDLGNSLQTIGFEAFKWCENINVVHFPNSLHEISSQVFTGCCNLKEVHIDDLSCWMNIRFGSNPLSNGALLYLNGEVVTDVVISDSIQTVREIVFQGLTSLKSVTIGDHVENIESGAFSNCINLTDVYIGRNVKTIGSHAFSNCINLTEIIIPDSVMNIEENAFSGCSGLTNVQIPDSVKSIGNSAFSDCTSITNINILEGTTSIGRDAFSGCTNLISISIPESIVEIGFAAFWDTNLKKVYYKGTADQWHFIGIDYWNSTLNNATFYYYSENQPLTDGNWWHYVDGVVTEW